MKEYTGRTRVLKVGDEYRVECEWQGLLFSGWDRLELNHDGSLRPLDLDRLDVSIMKKYKWDTKGQAEQAAREWRSKFCGPSTKSRVVSRPTNRCDG
jgi:hypothetical protein